MNKYNYEKYIVSDHNQWSYSDFKYTRHIIREDDFFNITNEHPEKWDMLKHSRIKPRSNFTYRYYIGYTLQNDYYNYDSNYERSSHYRKVTDCIFVDYGWLPFWGNATKKKYKITNEIKNYYIKKILFNKNIIKQYIIDNIWVEANNLPFEIKNNVLLFL